MRIEDHPILAFDKKEKVTFYFEDAPLEGYEGEPIAVALHGAGVRVIAETPERKRPRGIFCAIGNCSSCLMRVDGKPNVRTCTEPLKEGMNVRFQRGRGRLGASET